MGDESPHAAHDPAHPLTRRRSQRRILKGTLAVRPAALTIRRWEPRHRPRLRKRTEFAPGRPSTASNPPRGPENRSVGSPLSGLLVSGVMFVEAAGGVLVCGSLACAGAAILRRRHRVAATLLAAALACAAADSFGAG